MIFSSAQKERLGDILCAFGAVILVFVIGLIFYIPVKFYFDRQKFDKDEFNKAIMGR